MNVTKTFGHKLFLLGILLTLGLGFSVSSSVAQPIAPGSSNLPGPTLQPMGPSSTISKPPLGTSETPAASLPTMAAVQDENYQLGSGDKIRVVVYGEDDLGGEYLVDGGGLVQLPLLGQVKASGLTIRDFQKSIVAQLLSEGYLKDPRVSVEVENYRPFYIIGEVKTPGQYPFVSGMNVLNAVALAGGYTYRADDKRVYVRRNGSSQEVKAPADQTTKINPGDIIRIDERLF